MAKNVTSILNMHEIIASGVNDNDVLYLVHGSGSDRDKWIKVGELKKVVSVLGDIIVDSIEMHKAGENSQTSDVAFDGEKLIMSASGESVTDNSSLNISRLLQKFQRSISGGGSMSSEITPAGVVVKVESNNDAVQIEILSDKILFKSGDPLAQHASIVYDPTTGNLTINGIGGITLGDKLYAALGLVGDLETDSITPETTDSATPITIGSAAGGVQLVGRTTGFVGEVTTNLIKVDDPDYPISANAILKAPNLPNDFVEISSNLDSDASGAILLNSLWSLGAVKRIFNKDSSNHTMWIFTDNQGSNLSITIPRNSYVNLACIDFYDNPYDNKTYAVTVYN